MKAMQLRELAQEAYVQAGTTFSPKTRLRWLRFADKLTTLARERLEKTRDDENWRAEEWRAATRQ